MIKLAFILMISLVASCSTAMKGAAAPENGADPGQTGTEQPATPGEVPQAPAFKAFSFIQMSDTQLAFHTGDASDFLTDTLTLDTLVRQINRLRPPFVLVTGDMTDNSTNKAQLAAYRKVIDRVDKSIPVHHLPGNHDVGSACSKAKVAAFEQNYAQQLAWQRSIQTEFNEWFAALTQQLSVNTYIQRYQKVVTLSTGTSTPIELDMTGYSYSDGDVIDVFINGLIGIEGGDYSLTIANGVVTVTPMALKVGTVIVINATKSKIGSIVLETNNGAALVTNEDEYISA